MWQLLSTAVNIKLPNSFSKKTLSNRPSNRHFCSNSPARANVHWLNMASFQHASRHRNRCITGSPACVGCQESRSNVRCSHGNEATRARYNGTAERHLSINFHPPPRTKIQTRVGTEPHRTKVLRHVARRKKSWSFRLCLPLKHNLITRKPLKYILLRYI